MFVVFPGEILHARCRMPKYMNEMGPLGDRVKATYEVSSDTRLSESIGLSCYSSDYGRLDALDDGAVRL